MTRRHNIVLALTLCLTAGTAAPPELRRYDTPYYVVHTDLPPEGAAEAVVRMTRLGEDLRRRTRELGFTGRIDRRLPFYLYARHADYVAAGNPAESIGTFDGERLVAAATDARGSATWNVVQHEAFHQFAAATKGADLPAWLNEGLGEYFGEALFTGDGYVTGIVPAWRLARVKESMRAGRFSPLAGFARISQDDWNTDLKLDRYDQAWSIVQFLLHGNDGNLRPRLLQYVRALAEGKASDLFDADIETRWKAYWQSLPETGTVDLETETAVATITSFYARAKAQGQGFESFDAFAHAARDGSLRCSNADWLPPSLLRGALERLPKLARVELREDGVVARSPEVVLTGTFELRDGRVAAVNVARAGS